MIRRTLIIVFVLLLLLDDGNALPLPSISEWANRDYSAALTTLLNDTIRGTLDNIQTAGQLLDALIQAVGSVVPPPTNIPQIITAVASAYMTVSNLPSANIFDYAVQLLLRGINPKSIQTSVEALTTDNSLTNNNPHLSNVIKSDDPTFTVNEATLRSAIFIPSTFLPLNASNISAIIMVPATGTPGGQVWSAGYAKKLAQDRIANPVWLNIPTSSFQDAQITAEYVAYAINYISVYTGGRNVSVIAFSQGTLNTQWALKYFPSTRRLVSDYIALSPDFRGTILADFLCPGFPQLPCPASVLQQTFNSTFIRVLRQNGGDSEIVPTTTVYSATDEIVQPQSGLTASGFLSNANNNLIQEICPLQPAGLIYTHEGILYNPLGYALTVDALTHEGHANTSRMLANNPGICSLLSIRGLSVDSILITETLLVIVPPNYIFYVPKQFEEPPIQQYATY